MNKLTRLLLKNKGRKGKWQVRMAPVLGNTWTTMATTKVKVRKDLIIFKGSLS